MKNPSQSARDLAQRLLELETGSAPALGAHVLAGARVCAKLRNALVRFAGADGFTSLLRRALALARAELPVLQAVEVDADGSLEGFEQVVSTAGADAALSLIAHLLDLLVTFIGEPLTLRLVRDAWPRAAWSD